MLLLEIIEAGMFGRTQTAIKPSPGKRKKLTLLSKPHILLSHMVLLSEHLVLNLDWMEFQENPRFKKEVAHLGETNVSCFFSGIMICGSCGLLHME